MPCPTCGSDREPIRDGYAERIDVAFLEEEIHPSFFAQLAAWWRQMRERKFSGEGRVTFVWRNGEQIETMTNLPQVFRRRQRTQNVSTIESVLTEKPPQA